MGRSKSIGAGKGVVVGCPTMVRPGPLTIEDELEFGRAMGDYKRRSGRQFPTWSEILEVLMGLGYAKRIWRPVGRVSLPVAGSAPALTSFEALGEDSVTGLLCWCSRVETPSGI